MIREMKILILLAFSFATLARPARLTPIPPLFSGEARADARENLLCKKRGESCQSQDECCVGYYCNIHGICIVF